MIDNRRKLQGTVVSDKMEKSVVVRVDRQFKHPQVKKFITRWKKYMAHDENNECGIGDTVQIVESAPMSKRKRWTVTKVIEKAK